MNIASLSSAATALHAIRMPEAKEAPGPDRDGDSDDKSSVQPSTSTPAGMGAKVNTVA